MAGTEAYRLVWQDARGAWHMRRDRFDTAGAAIAGARNFVASRSLAVAWRIEDATGATVADSAQDADRAPMATLARTAEVIAAVNAEPTAAPAPAEDAKRYGREGGAVRRLHSGSEDGFLWYVVGADGETVYSGIGHACEDGAYGELAYAESGCDTGADIAPADGDTVAVADMFAPIAAQDADRGAVLRGLVATLASDATVTAREASAVIAWCREWCRDCAWSEDADTIEDMPAATILAASHRHIDGGLRFVLADVRRLAAPAKPAAIDATAQGAYLAPAPVSIEDADRIGRTIAAHRERLAQDAASDAQAIEHAAVTGATLAAQDADRELAAGWYAVRFEDAHGARYAATIEAQAPTARGAVINRARLAVWREDGTSAAIKPLGLVGIEATAAPAKPRAVGAGWRVIESGANGERVTRLVYAPDMPSAAALAQATRASFDCRIDSIAREDANHG